MKHRAATLTTLLVALALGTPPALAGGAPSADAAPPPWRTGERIDDLLLEAQTALLLGEGTGARGRARGARAAFSGPGGLRAQLRPRAAGAAAEVSASLADAVHAARARDQVGLAIARGAARAAILRASFDSAAAAAGADDPARAGEWLLLREFRTATRVSRPVVDATEAVAALREGEIAPAAARLAVEKDLLDAYQSRLRELLDDARVADANGFEVRGAERAALARGFWRILAPRYREEMGLAAARQADGAFARLVERAGDGRELATAVTAAERTLDGFTAAPFTDEEQARYAIQLLRFIELIPIEYDHGVDDDRVTIPFEIQEAKSFRDGAALAFSDLEAELEQRDPAATRDVEAALERLKAAIADAATGAAVAPESEVEETATVAADALEATYPEEWKASSVESDFDLVDLTLARMDAAIAAGQYEQAEQDRLAAYAFFEFGPELRLRSLDPGLAFDIEGLVWFGARGEDGLAELIARRAPASEAHPVRLLLDELLADARTSLGDGAGRATVVTNAALVVFREGLEAVLILAAVLAGLTGARRRLRRPVAGGVAVALVASALTFVAAQTLLSSLSQYGEKLEAIVGLVAVGVLLVVLNWFLHKVYWTGWISGFHRRRRRLLAVAGGGLLSAQVLGFALLGFSMTYREGFETVLFLQAMELNAGLAAVLEGTALGLVAVAAVGVVTFRLEQRLPYKRMLIVTGILIGFVLVVLVGNTARTMQGVGWLPITPIDADLPYWLGLWFGVYPTWQTIGAQLAAAAFVIGSYFAAEWVRKRRPRPAAPAEELRSPDTGARPRPLASSGARPWR